MDENKLPFNNILKLIAQKKKKKNHFPKKKKSLKEQGLNCPKKQPCFQRKILFFSLGT
jgi:hypothetical protein